MKKILLIILLIPVLAFAQSKEQVTLKDSTLFKQYNQRLNVLTGAFNNRLIEIAKKDSTCREIQTAINEVRYWLSEEVKKQRIEEKK